jgi:hypothetical protein
MANDGDATNDDDADDADETKATEDDERINVRKD